MASASVPGLLGGLLNGDGSSDKSPLLDAEKPLLFTVKDSSTEGFSRRGAGGRGATFDSRRNSPDLLGGGGEGAFEPRGDLGGGMAGEGLVGRLGPLVKGLGEPPGVDGLATESGFRKAGCSSTARTEVLLLGGDCGGWIITAGVCGFGAYGLGTWGFAAGVGFVDRGRGGGCAFASFSG